MRIAVVHNLPSGGAKRVLYEYVRRLCEAHTVDLYCFDVTDDSFCPLKGLVNAVHTINLGDTLLGGLRYRRAMPRLLIVPQLKRAGREIARQIDGRGYDVAFIHGCDEISSPYVLKYLTMPSVYYCQQPYRGLEALAGSGRLGWTASGLVRQMYARIDAANAREATMMLASSCFCRESLYRTYGLFAHVSHLGVDAEMFRPRGHRRVAAVLAVGSLYAHKAQELLIRSVARLTNRPEVWLAYNWSPAHAEKELSSLAASLGVTLKLMPQISDDDLVAAYNTAAIVVSMSVMELFGLTALEAMACGAPMVAVNEGGYRESVVDGVTGYLVERDAEQVADALARLLADAELRDRMGAEARRRVEQHWTWDHAYQVLERHLLSSQRIAAHS